MLSKVRTNNVRVERDRCKAIATEFHSQRNSITDICCFGLAVSARFVVEFIILSLLAFILLRVASILLAKIY